MKTPLSTIKTGDILLVSSHTWLARQIQKFQSIESKEAGKWNHAAMFWWCYDELFVIEADKYGIACTPFKEYIATNKDLLICRTKFAVDGSAYGKFMLPYAGHTRYGKWNLIVAQSIKILTFGKVWIGPSKRQLSHFICGEFCGYVTNHFNSAIFTNWNRIAPVDIYLNPNFNHDNFVR